MSLINRRTSISSEHIFAGSKGYYSKKTVCYLLREEAVQQTRYQEKYSSTYILLSAFLQIFRPWRGIYIALRKSEMKRESGSNGPISRQKSRTRSTSPYRESRWKRLVVRNSLWFLHLKHVQEQERRMIFLAKGTSSLLSHHRFFHSQLSTGHLLTSQEIRDEKGLYQEIYYEFCISSTFGIWNCGWSLKPRKRLDFIISSHKNVRLPSPNHIRIRVHNEQS